jgi:hypothetical protein
MKPIPINKSFPHIHRLVLEFISELGLVDIDHEKFTSIFARMNKRELSLFLMDLSSTMCEFLFKSDGQNSLQVLDLPILANEEYEAMEGIERRL